MSIDGWFPGVEEAQGVHCGACVRAELRDPAAAGGRHPSEGFGLRRRHIPAHQCGRRMVRDP